MDDLRCPICKRRRGSDPRAIYCSARCRWRAYWARAVSSAEKVDALLPAVLAADVEDMAGSGPERSRRLLQLALFQRAPAGARGYRVGIKYGRSQIQRWFPIARRSEVPMLLLDPFEAPIVPVAGQYAVVYLDGRCVPIGGPRFSIGIDDVDRRLSYCEGDRTWKPRLR